MQKQTGGRIDLNSASAEKIAEIDGVSRSVAEAIVAYRDHHGSFQKSGDLEDVEGVGPATRKKLARYGAMHAGNAQATSTGIAPETNGGTAGLAEQAFDVGMKYRQPPLGMPVLATPFSVPRVTQATTTIWSRFFSEYSDEMVSLISDLSRANDVFGVAKAYRNHFEATGDLIGKTRNRLALSAIDAMG